MEVTDKAKENILALRQTYGTKDSALRFGLSGGGCSGYKYILEFDETTKDDDLIFSFEQFNLIVNKSHIDLLKNSTIDWKDSLMEAGFDIINPQAKQPCGCGESVNF